MPTKKCSGDVSLESVCSILQSLITNSTHIKLKRINSTNKLLDQFLENIFRVGPIGQTDRIGLGYLLFLDALLDHFGLFDFDLLVHIARPRYLPTLVKHVHVNIAHAFGHLVPELLGLKTLMHEAVSLVEQRLLGPILDPVGLTVVYHVCVVPQYELECVAARRQCETNVQVAFDSCVKKLFRVQHHVGILFFDARPNRMIQAVHLVVAEQVKAFAIV